MQATEYSGAFNISDNTSRPVLVAILSSCGSLRLQSSRDADKILEMEISETAKQERRKEKLDVSNLGKAVGTTINQLQYEIVKRRDLPEQLPLRVHTNRG
jgi:hypothetical protein